MSKEKKILVAAMCGIICFGLLIIISLFTKKDINNGNMTKFDSFKRSNFTKEVNDEIEKVGFIGDLEKQSNHSLTKEKENKKGYQEVSKDKKKFIGYIYPKKDTNIDEHFSHNHNVKGYRLPELAAKEHIK